MIKKFLLIVLLATTFANAQHTLNGKMQPNGDYEWMILYHMQGAKQNYIANADIVEGEFSFTLADSLDVGIYRLVYDLQNQLFVDVIYNNEDIAFIFNPENPNQEIQFTASDENKLYYDYLNSTTIPQYQLDSLQVAYFKSLDKQNIVKAYEKNYQNLKNIQQQFEKQSEGKLAHHFIKASARYNPEEPIEKPNDYLKSTKAHFFDNVDFTDKTLLNSTFITDKINDYIFYLNASDDQEVNNQLKKEAISSVITKIGENYSLAKDIEEVLLYNFTQQQNVPIVKFILDNYYTKLPTEYQDLAFKKDVEAKIKTALGNKAPNISWADDNLYHLSGFDNYVIVFWSTQCGHCLKEIPVLYDFLKDNSNTKVIAIGMEEDVSRPIWDKMVLNYPNFINVYGANKWQNKFAQAYGINSTPSYFILDTDKNIIAKPDDVEELKVFFEVK
ncbi:TlpA disulfide reductase family protein [Aureibaculum sp. 2210JD6-5]|uniref:TlpA family protein disulfide reductase n=1 Tax=Aureibaculum sp. 2210JD6-5 TaxID=3103957 RepID=UPI002AAE8FCD|nr:TlpA disulfide reductase family protein [Aureibaculum sp. 2210JD6-5]MDY7395931.1 TlpA disulfide reductase family protein [Aureibaculum sp. 2210JD6-5]